MSDLGVQALCAGFGVRLVGPLTWNVPSGHIMAIEGPSGCGKSTLLRTIAGIQPPLEGNVLLDGTIVTNVPVHQREITMVFQEPLLFAHLSVSKNVGYGLRMRGATPELQQARSAELLNWLGIATLADRMPHELSGGQAQRVAIARALAPHPRALLLDEPFSALDAPLRLRLAHDVRELVTAMNIAALHVTHDPDEARAMGDLHLHL